MTGFSYQQTEGQYMMPWTVAPSSSAFGNQTNNPVGINLSQLMDGIQRVSQWTATTTSSNGDSLVNGPYSFRDTNTQDKISGGQNPSQATWLWQTADGRTTIEIFMGNTILDPVGNKFYPGLTVTGVDSIGNPYSTNNAAFSSNIGTLTWYGQTAGIYTDPSNPAAAIDVTITPKTYF